jgi:hypothetical protein
VSFSDFREILQQSSRVSPRPDQGSHSKKSGNPDICNSGIYGDTRPTPSWAQFTRKRVPRHPCSSEIFGSGRRNSQRDSPEKGSSPGSVFMVKGARQGMNIPLKKERSFSIYSLGVTPE